jgi:hypothetical protein
MDNESAVFAASLYVCIWNINIFVRTFAFLFVNLSSKQKLNNRLSGIFSLKCFAGFTKISIFALAIGKQCFLLKRMSL